MLPVVVVVQAASGIKTRQPVKAVPLTVILGTVIDEIAVVPVTCVIPLVGAMVAAEGVEPCAACEGGAHGPALTLRRATAANPYNGT